MSLASSVRPIPPRWWGDQQDALSVGATKGFAAVGWNWADGVYETIGEADPHTHALSFSLDPLETEFLLDRRAIFKGQFQPGMLAIIPAGEQPWAIQRGAARKLHIYLPKRLVSEAANNDSRSVSIDPVLTTPRVLADGNAAALCRQVVRVLADTGPGSAMLLEALGLQLAVHALRHWSNFAHVDERDTRTLGNTAMGVVTSYMRDNLARDMSLSELAHLAGLSTAHFCRSFRKAAGVPPHRYLLNIRIEKALELLATNDKSISDIAAEVGYDDPSYFARLFRKQLGIAPHAYRLVRRL